jgi:hypothetical protein
MLGIAGGKTVRREKSLKIKREGVKLETYGDSNGVQVPNMLGNLSNWHFKYLLA